MGGVVIDRKRWQGRRAAKEGNNQEAEASGLNPRLA